MTRSELIDLMADSQSQLSPKDVELAVKLLIDTWQRPCRLAKESRSEGLAAFRSIIVSPARVGTRGPAMPFHCVANMCLTLSPGKNCVRE